MDDIVKLRPSLAAVPEHTCMAMRGVGKHDASTVTTQFMGVFRDEQTRFFNLLRGAR